MLGPCYAGSGERAAHKAGGSAFCGGYILKRIVQSEAELDIVGLTR